MSTPDTVSRRYSPARVEGSWATITTALDQAVGPGRPSGAWTRYCCPAHEGDGKGHRPSLGVKYDQVQARTVVRCFAGCDNELVLNTLGLGVRDMFDRPLERSGRGPAPRPRLRRLSPADRAIDAAGLPLAAVKKELGQQVSPWQQTAVYPYTRADGTVAGEVIRHEARFEHGRDKKFHQRAWNPQSGWADTGFDKLPFQLPRVLEAIADHRTVYVCEGEKDVLAAESAGLVATTNAGGAAAWTAEHARWLAGAHTVVIVTDRDAPGYRRAERVMASLSGLVARVRVVQAATGKDLHEHLQAGHEIGELEPIAHLDPFTRTTAVSADIPAAAAPGSMATATPEGTPDMGFFDSDPAPQVHHDDTVDTAGRQWAAFMQLLMMHLLTKVRRQIEASREAADKHAADTKAEKERVEAEKAAEKAAVEARLRKVREGGLHNASREEIARAVAEAAAWSQDSPAARQALAELRTHVKDRFGIEIDAVSGKVVIEATSTPELAARLATFEAERASMDRVKKAQDHMVGLVAAEELDQSVKEELYAAIEKWRTNPTAARLGELTKKLAHHGVGEATRTQIRFIASYLGTPGQQTTVADGIAPTISPTVELRKMAGPLVDPGEVAKPAVDRLFETYQDRLRAGMSTTGIRAQLDKILKVLPPADQAAAKARGNEIRKNPAGRFTRLWPDHVDRDELAATVRAYVTMAHQAEASAVKANNIDDVTAAAMAKFANQHKAAIKAAIDKGKGLHPLERDQLASILRDVEAGKTRAPEVLFVDDRSAAAIDADRATRIAHDTARAHRRQVEKVLDTNAVPTGTLRRTREDLTKVMDAQAALANGRASLSDYERTGLAKRFDLRLAASGVSKPIRNQVAAHLDLAAGEAASLGKTAQRVADRWADRHSAVEAERSPAQPTYGSAAARAAFDTDLQAAGLDPDQRAQHHAAASGRTNPASAAVKRAPGEARRTSPGAGVRRINHRGKGPGRGDQSPGR